MQKLLKFKATVLGNDHGNIELYCIRAKFRNGTHVGKKRKDTEKGMIPFDHKE